MGLHTGSKFLLLPGVSLVLLSLPLDKEQLQDPYHEILGFVRTASKAYIYIPIIGMDPSSLYGYIAQGTPRRLQDDIGDNLSPCITQAAHRVEEALGPVSLVDFF